MESKSSSSVQNYSDDRVMESQQISDLPDTVHLKPASNCEEGDADIAKSSVVESASPTELDNCVLDTATVSADVPSVELDDASSTPLQQNESSGDRCNGIQSNDDTTQPSTESSSASPEININSMTNLDSAAIELRDESAEDSARPALNPFVHRIHFRFPYDYIKVRSPFP